MILGVTVVEDIFIAIYLAIVSVVLSGETDFWPIVGKLAIAFTFLVVMFGIARWGGRFVSRLFRTKDDELFTILFFGLAVLFAGIGEVLGVTDAIGAFLIGLVLGATKFRNRIEHIAIPLRDVFAAFFFLNFGLLLDPAKFPDVLRACAAGGPPDDRAEHPAGQFVAWLNGLGVAGGDQHAVILQNRGEFALILATLSLSAGLDCTHTAVRGPLRARHGGARSGARSKLREDRWDDSADRQDEAAQARTKSAIACSTRRSLWSRRRRPTSAATNGSRDSPAGHRPGGRAGHAAAGHHRGPKAGLNHS